MLDPQPAASKPIHRLFLDIDSPSMGFDAQAQIAMLHMRSDELAAHINAIPNKKGLGQ